MLLRLQLILYFIVVDIFEIDISPGIEEIVSCIANDLRFFKVVNLIIIESVPMALILSVSCVMTRQNLTIVIAYTEEIIDKRSCALLLLRDDILRHVKLMKWEMHQLVLFRLIAFEALQVYDQNGWSFKDLDFLNSLLVGFTSIAEPLILVAQFFRNHKLPEAVINGNFIILIVHHRVNLSYLLRVDLFEFLVSDQILIECPTSRRIETDLQLEL